MNSFSPRRLARWIGPALALALLTTTACGQTRKDEATLSAGEQKPAAKPPGEGEPFHKFAQPPAGPPVLDGYDPSLVGITPVVAQVEDDEREGASVIAQTELAEFIKHGPRHPLTLVQVQPAFEGTSFVGYRVVGFTDTGAQTLGRALKPGDVVLKVNDRSIARPEDYMAVWTGLESCDKLTVKVLREGQPVEMAWQISKAANADK